MTDHRPHISPNRAPVSASSGLEAIAAGLNSIKGKGPGPLWLSRRDVVEKMLADGLGTSEIAARFGCTRGCVRTALNRLGLRVSLDRRAEENRAKMKAQWRRPEFRAAMSAAARKGGARSWRKVLDCVPAPYLEEYKRIVRSGVPCAEARAYYRQEWPKLIARALNQIAEVAKPLAEEQRRHRNSIEGQIERIKAGTARVVPTFKPGRVLAEQRSLIGGSMADLAA